MKVNNRLPPTKYKEGRNSTETSLFGLIILYLSDWDLSRVQSTMFTLDKSQEERYYPLS